MMVLAITWLYWFKLGHFFPPMSATRKERAVERVQTDFQHFIALIERVRHPTLTSLSTLQKKHYCNVWCGTSPGRFLNLLLLWHYWALQINVKLPHFVTRFQRCSEPLWCLWALGALGQKKWLCHAVNSWPIHPHLSGLFCSWGNWWLTHIYQWTLLGKPAFRAFKAVLSDSGAESPNPAAPWVTWVDRFEKVQLWETANKKLQEIPASQMDHMDPSQVRLPHLVSLPGFLFGALRDSSFPELDERKLCRTAANFIGENPWFRGPIFASSSSLNPRSGWKIPILHHFSRKFHEQVDNSRHVFMVKSPCITKALLERLRAVVHPGDSGSAHDPWGVGAVYSRWMLH